MIIWMAKQLFKFNFSLAFVKFLEKVLIKG